MLKEIKKLHLEIDELPYPEELRSELWQATEYLNEGDEVEAEKIKEEVKRKLDYLLANCKPVGY